MAPPLVAGEKNLHTWAPSVESYGFCRTCQGHQVTHRKIHRRLYWRWCDRRRSECLPAGAIILLSSTCHPLHAGNENRNRVPFQLLSGKGALGDVEKVSRIFVRNELTSLQERFKEINDWLGMEVIRFKDYSIETEWPQLKCRLQAAHPQSSPDALYATQSRHRLMSRPHHFAR